MKVHKIPLSTQKQKDYLVGVNTNTVNKSNPKASLAFTHVMSRITLNIKKAEDNLNAYKIPEVTLNNVIGEAILEVEGGHPYLSSISNENSSITVKPINYVLEQSSDVATVDFLLLPTVQNNITVKLGGFSQEIKLPMVDFESNKQYSFNVVINNNELVSSSPVITSWQNPQKEEESTINGTMRVKAAIGDFFYADGTYSHSYNGKEVIGVVFALTQEKNGKINRTLRESYHGRIVAKSDCKHMLYGGPYFMKNLEDVSSLYNYEISGNGNTTIDEYGRIVEWPTEGSLSDFEGQQNTKNLSVYNAESADKTWEAWYLSLNYKTNGTLKGNWYLPAMGELYLIYLLEEKFKKNFSDSPNYTSLFYGYFDSYHRDYWSSTECNADIAWMLASIAVR